MDGIGGWVGGWVGGTYRHGRVHVNGLAISSGAEGTGRVGASALVLLLLLLLARAAGGLGLGQVLFGCGWVGGWVR